MGYKISCFIPAILLLLLLSCAVISKISADNLISADVPFSYGEDKFIERIRKKVEGRAPVGLVLSGGSARAFAHIGVLRRMEELGIVPDFIVTNSMGSIVGLLYGFGFSPNQISEIIESTDIGELFKIAFPLGGGIINVDKFSGMLYNFTGEIDLSKLPIPVMVLCEDLRTKRLVKIAEGDFSTVMMAAYSLPLYFKPVHFRDHLLIDGGIANLVPLDSAYEYSDTIIASTSFYQNPKLNLKNPITNLNVAIDIGKSRTGVSQIKFYEPLLIRCDVESFSFMDFGSLKEIQEAGYRSADGMKEQLSALDAEGVTEELEKQRADNQIRINIALNNYHHIESIPVLDPSLILIAKIDVFNSPRSMRFLNDDFRVGGGIDFSYKYFTTAVTGGFGTNLSNLRALFPTADLRAAWDPAYFLRFNLDYGVRFETLDTNGSGFPNGGCDSSDVFVSMTVVPFASENLSFGFHASGELTFESLSSLQESIVTIQAEFAVDSNPNSENNYTADLFLGSQLANTGNSITIDNPSIYGDLGISIPFPGSYGLFKLNSRGFSRQALNGGSVKSYVRDGMRTSIIDSEFSHVSFTSTDFIFNPWKFRPAVAELIMFKEIDLSAFGELGWHDSMFWGAGLTLRIDLSLIGLKPVSLRGFAGYDSISSGIIGGVTILQ